MRSLNSPRLKLVQIGKFGAIVGAECRFVNLKPPICSDVFRRVLEFRADLSVGWTAAHAADN